MWWLILYAWIYSVIVPLLSLVMWQNRNRVPLNGKRTQVPWMITSAIVGVVIITIIHLHEFNPESKTFYFLYLFSLY